MVRHMHAHFSVPDRRFRGHQQRQWQWQRGINCVLFSIPSVQHNLGLSSITKQQRCRIWTDQIAVAAGTGRL